MSVRLIEKPENPHAVLIINGCYHVGIPDIVYPWHMFVANAFNAVSSKAVQHQCGALQGFGSHYFHCREAFFEAVTCTDGPG